MPDPHDTALPDRGQLLTEQRLPDAAAIDQAGTADVLALINAQDMTVASVVSDAIEVITPLVDAVVASLSRGGRLIYLGAGTSGRLAVLDASECPPTFFTEPGQVVGIIAGGDAALRKSAEGAEDDPQGSIATLDDLGLTPHDVVVAIAAGGTTPYAHGALQHARQHGTTTGFVCCVPLTALLDGATPGDPTFAAADLDAIDHLIELPVGPEVVTGSTRLKAGTATKLCLNMITTAAMVRLGKTWGNLMVDLRATNTKLRDRAVRILTTQTDLSRDAALALLHQADGRVKLALVMARRNVTADAAERLLKDADGHLRPIIGPPRP